MKKKVIIASLLLVWLPFVLLTDIFPFLRFAMFAEPVQEVPQEIFHLYAMQDGKAIKFNTYLWGIDEGVFHYIVRKYYYQNRMAEFWRNICSIHQGLYPHYMPISWELHQIIIYKGKQERKIVASNVLCSAQ